MRKKRLPHTPVKPGKRLASDSRKENKMKTLSSRNDRIELGVYAGETLYTVLMKYGKKALPKLLRYYNLSEEIMKQYHCHLEPHKEDRAAESTRSKTNVSLNGKVSQVTTIVMDPVDMGLDSDDNCDTTGRVANDENNWTSSRSDYENGVLYDPEDDQPVTPNDRSMMATGGAHLYWCGNSFHMGTSVNY